MPDIAHASLDVLQHIAGGGGGVVEPASAVWELAWVQLDVVYFAARRQVGYVHMVQFVVAMRLLACEHEVTAHQTFHL